MGQFEIILGYTIILTNSVQLFTSVNQSPCDVAVELGGVCVAGRECTCAFLPAISG